MKDNFRKRSGQGLYVQFGSGFNAPQEWINFDASPTLRFERIPILGRLYTKNSKPFPRNVRYGNVVSGLPVGSNSCLGVYASHVLEHLSLNDMRLAIRETWRILKTGAVFRLIVPDLEILTKDYLSSEIPNAALVFMRNSGLGREQRGHGLGGLIKDHWGNSAHLWLWDFKSLAAELSSAGFVGIRRCAFNDSCDPMFQQVEDTVRFDRALAIETFKPRQ